MRFQIRLLRFLTLMAAFLIITSKTFAAMPDITAGETSFNIFKGCYIFRNNVRVSDRGMVMTAKQATAQMTSQKVWATGGVTFEQEGIKFKCDKILVKAAESYAEVIGGLNLMQDDGAIKITGDVGKFSWDDKCADFYGKVKLTVSKNAKVKIDSNLNVKPNKINGAYAHIRYNIVEKKIVALDKEYSKIPSQEFSEPDPTE